MTITILDKLARQAKERRAATNAADPGGAGSTWQSLTLINGPRGGHLEFVESPAQGNYSASIMCSVKSVKGKTTCFGIDAAFCAELAGIDFAGLAEACEQTARLSQVATPVSQVATPVSAAAGPVKGLFDDLTAKGVFVAPAKRWNTILGLPKRIEWLIALAPDYEDDFRALTSKADTDAYLNRLIDVGIAVQTAGGPRPA
jgi:hypothetical protein